MSSGYYCSFPKEFGSWHMFPGFEFKILLSPVFQFMLNILAFLQAFKSLVLACDRSIYSTHFALIFSLQLTLQIRINNVYDLGGNIGESFSFVMSHRVFGKLLSHGTFHFF